MTEQETIDKSVIFAKANKKSIAERLTDTKKFIPETNPVSVFMAVLQVLVKQSLQKY